MIRLYAIVEGWTEEGFVRQVLQNHLAFRSVFVVPLVVMTSRDRRNQRVYRGGTLSYAQCKRDIQRTLASHQQPHDWVTTMFDLYRLPDDFPGKSDANQPRDPQQRVAHLEKALERDIDHRRFIPYIQLHEFEALLFSDVQQFDWEFLEHGDAIRRLANIAGGFASPELINDGPHTAPSKRIIGEIPEYADQKSTAGPLIASKIGLSKLRESCAHFGAWVARLEALAEPSRLSPGPVRARRR